MSGSLAGRRIVVTRPPDDGRLRCLLEAEGAAVLECPAIQIAPPSDYGPLDDALRNLAAYGWIVFTSRNGVAAVIGRMSALGMTPETLARARLAVIGPGTAEALREHGLAAALAPEEFRAEALVEAFARRDVRGVRVLLPRAAVARNVLPDGLRALGAAVDVVAAYRTAPGTPAPGALEAVRTGAIDAVTFTSSSTVRYFLRLAGPDARRILEGVFVACIGPVTAETARDAGLRVGAVASTYTLAGLVDALRGALGARPGSVVPSGGR